MHLFVDIYSHGFGHLAITASVLSTLAEVRPDLRLTLRQHIHSSFELIAEASDFGYVMGRYAHRSRRQYHRLPPGPRWPARARHGRSGAASRIATRPGAGQRQLLALGGIAHRLPVDV
jgi:hypothetical protein